MSVCVSLFLRRHYFLLHGIWYWLILLHKQHILRHGIMWYRLTLLLCAVEELCLWVVGVCKKQMEESNLLDFTSEFTYTWPNPHHVQTRDKFPRMLLARTINNHILSLWSCLVWANCQPFLFTAFHLILFLGSACFWLPLKVCQAQVACNSVSGGIVWCWHSQPVIKTQLKALS